MEEKNLINIIEKAKNGEEESFELLFLKYKNYIDRTSSIPAPLINLLNDVLSI